MCRTEDRTLCRTSDRTGVPPGKDLGPETKARKGPGTRPWVTARKGHGTRDQGVPPVDRHL